MRALELHGVGAPADVLVVRERPLPEPAAGQIRIETELCPISLPDVMLCRGTYAQTPNLPFVPGMEALGVVAEVGEGVDERLLGHRVIGVPVMPHGGLAESSILEADYVVPVPDGIAAEPAAAALISFTSAHLGLFRRAGLRAGETLLVHGGSSGIGAAAIQLGVDAGATVLATARTPEKVAACLAQGATAALDTGSADFVEWALDHTAGRGADVILDPIGGDVFDRSRRCIGVDGRIVVAGFAGGRVGEVRTSHVLFNNYSVVGLYVGAYRRDPDDRALVHQVQQHVLDMVRTGRVAPLIDRVVPLADGPVALSDLEERRVLGKALVHVRR